MFDGCMFEIAGESLEVIYSDTSVGANTNLQCNLPSTPPFCINPVVLAIETTPYLMEYFLFFKF